MGKQRGRLSCWSGETFPALRGRRRMSTQLDQIAAKAKSEPKLRFTSLAHLITPEFLKETWKQMNRRGASGVDGETTKEFERSRPCLARGLPGSTGAPSGDTQGTWQGRDETARNSDGRRSPATKSGRADPGSGVRGGFPGMLVWISARM